MRRLLLLVLGIPIAVFGGFLGAIILASEMAGEVVTVHSTAADGSTKATRLWIAEDDDGTLWLRAGVPSETWIGHIAENPMVEVDRGGTTSRMRATAVTGDPTVRDKVHALMRRDYESVDTLISMLRDGNQSIPVRLGPAA